MADEAGFADFYRAAYPGLVAELYAYTGSLAEAQEVAQEAFTRAWARWRRISAYDQPRAWVARVGYRLAVSRWRRARSALTGQLRHGPPPPVAPPGENSVALVAALSRLPEPQRRAIVLHHMGGYPVAEIAAREGVAEGTVKARLSRGRQRLAELLDDGEREEAGRV
ncbi:RNA polymerase sigma factor [Actinomadura parmotrematis]|uniref:Sigma-70 family RNA polymerase sigma factor n=1 Tax=Actinomadura parmotrematis TaxID=2864039 RepID=A0ABS7FSB1_9ACTN|nr:sigma-70 family RNA polymerase sigma factor [Actinomadura parmotrematis]MBW8483191.1 sigma-70 family RNA polymerase sigma factor [Actinomadura parmotrematis]